MTDTTKVEEVVVVEPEVVEKTVITEGAAKEGGLSEQEVEMGKKHGIIENDSDKKDDKSDKIDDKEPDKSDINADDKIPEVTADDIRKKDLKEVTDEEAAKLTKNEQGYYWSQKKERAKRQTAESDRDFYRMRIAALEEKVENIGTVKKDEKDEKDDIDTFFEDNDDDDDDDIDNAKDKAEGTDKKLSEKEWKDKQDKENQAMAIHNQRVNAKLNEFEVETKEAHADLNEVLDLATDIFNGHKTIFKDPGKQREIEGKINDWKIATAEILQPNAKNIAELAYEIGKLHPNYKPDGKAKTAEEDDDGEKISEGKMDKLLKNQRGRTSASLSGGSTRVPVSELTLAQAAKLSSEDWSKLPRDVKDRLMGKP